MLRKMIFWLMLLLFSLCSLSPVSAAGDGVVILCYHDIGKVSNNKYTVTKQNLADHLAYLKRNGYTPISLQQYIDFNEGRVALPEKPIMLTFDDGYVSFYNDVFPLLKQYQYPAVLALVTSWQTAYKPPDVGQLVNWQQVREMEQSGLVAIASHTHDLHHGVIANEYGDGGEAASALVYRNGKYETSETYKTRIAKDLEETQQVFQRELGHKVETLVWPYGEYTLPALDIAKSQGFKVFFTLGIGSNLPGAQSLSEAKRGIIYENPNVQQLAKFIKRAGDDNPPLRATFLNIDSLYDPLNPRQTDHNIRLAIDRFYSSGVNTVFLQGFSDPKGDGNITSVYFHTNAAPVKAPIFDHIARKLRSEGIFVYAWMPTLAAQWLIKDADYAVTAADASGKGWYKRATPFSEDVRTGLRELYTDLATYSFLDGVVFQDDIYLNNNEDFSPFAKLAFQKKFGQPLTSDMLKNPQIMAEWTELKTNKLTELTVEMMSVVRQHKPYAKFARTIYPEVVMATDAQARYAQSYVQFLATYDYTLVAPTTYLERQGPPPVQWMSDLAATALRQPGAAEKLIFEVPTYDWLKKRWLLDNEIKDYIMVLREKGARLFGFYPDALFNEKSGLQQYKP